MAELTIGDVQTGLTEYLYKLQQQGVALTQSDRDQVVAQVTQLWNAPADQWPQGQRPVSVAGWVKNVIPFINQIVAEKQSAGGEESFYMKPYVYIPVALGIGAGLYFLVLKK